MKKKVTSIFLVFVMLLTLIPQSALLVSAESGGTTVGVENMSAFPGDTVDVYVTISNNPGILGMTLSVFYDESALTLKDAACGDALKDVLQMTMPGEFKSQCRFIWDGLELDEEDIRDGEILVLTFDVDKNADKGSYLIHVFYNPGDIVDNDLKPVDLEIKDGNVNVK